MSWAGEAWAQSLELAERDLDAWRTGANKMSNIQRLKFAWARGARIQIAEDDEWCEEICDCPQWNLNYHYRIHPDDAHLEYGPLSSTMLEWARSPKFSTVSNTDSSTEWHAAKQFWLAARFPTDIDGGAPLNYAMTENDCRLLALFLAEMLADEGL